MTFKKEVKKFDRSTFETMPFILEKTTQFFFGPKIISFV